jgi:hypothetical protein
LPCNQLKALEGSRYGETGRFGPARVRAKFATDRLIDGGNGSLSFVRDRAFMGDSGSHKPFSVTERDTEQEALANVEEAIRAILQYRQEQGMMPPSDAHPEIRHVTVAAWCVGAAFQTATLYLSPGHARRDVWRMCKISTTSSRTR